ncbi:MAG: DNA polymerase III subunit delta [Peptococcaceae bacterium]|nr:DNA polymerase III subunit delta [Peptococcaceae bacterium]
MKYFIDLVNDLNAGRVAPVYLFFGPESYLRGEAVKRIRDLLAPGGTGDFNHTLVDGEETTLADITALAGMAPFFAGKRLVVVQNAKFFAGKKGGPETAGREQGEEETAAARSDETPFLDYLAAPNPSTCIVFDAGDQVDKRKKIYREVAKTGKVVEFALLRPDQLAAWLEKQARQAGKTLGPGAAAEILARAGNSLQALSVEIQKLISYAGESGVITVEDVAAATPPHPEEDVFAVVDAIGEKNPARAMAGIARLLRQKQPPPAILAMVARQIRLILRTGEALRSGGQPGNLASRMGIHPFVARKMAGQQKNFDRRQLIESLHRLHDLDTAVKSGRQEFLAGMEMFILDVCRKKKV